MTFVVTCHLWQLILQVTSFAVTCHLYQPIWQLTSFTVTCHLYQPIWQVTSFAVTCHLWQPILQVTSFVVTCHLWQPILQVTSFAELMVEKDVANLKTNLQHFGHNVDIRCLFLKDFVKEDQFTETIRSGFPQSTLMFLSVYLDFSFSLPWCFFQLLLRFFSLLCFVVWLHQCQLSSYKSHSLQHFD